METSFQCTCGNIFGAAEVEAALSTVTLLKQRLIQQIRDIDVTESQIRYQTATSFSTWLSVHGYDIGTLLGKAAAKLVTWLEKYF